MNAYVLIIFEYVPESAMNGKCPADWVYGIIFSMSAVAAIFAVFAPGHAGTWKEGKWKLQSKIRR
ncbi:MAG: hypothetical protein ABFD62_01035 [Syntrophaceae bacterium]